MLVVRGLSAEDGNLSRSDGCAEGRIAEDVGYKPVCEAVFVGRRSVPTLLNMYDRIVMRR